jgi:hypothetical protein
VPLVEAAGRQDPPRCPAIQARPYLHAHARSRRSARTYLDAEACVTIAHADVDARPTRAHGKADFDAHAYVNGHGGADKEQQHRRHVHAAQPERLGHDDQS